ncbi:MAG TPA: helix-turn-helix transcriptional regulator [Candidatus Eisenbacteria bacterium]|nr:helix-turn-helix transcriptional regulator [Candidatus Eisenbacteria bacterium]
MADTPDPVTANERIRAARERAGLEHGEMADKVGISWEEYWDIEGFEEDVWCCHSFDTLHRLAQALGLTLLGILEGDDSVDPAESMSFADFRSAVAESVRASGGDADAWGERAGWDVEPVLRDPEAFWKRCPDELRDVANAAGIDWRAVLPK